jgi:hypothetical protein
VKASDAPAALSAYEPRSYDEVRLIAQDLSKAKLSKARTPEQVILIMATGHELGLPPAAALRTIYLIESDGAEIPSLSADGMVALCLKNRQLCEYFECVEVTDKGITYATKRVGRAEQRFTYTIDDAKREGLIPAKEKSRWSKDPIGQCGKRASSRLARRVYPDVLAGLYAPEEILDERGETTVDPVQPLPRAAAQQPIDAEVVESKKEAPNADELVVTLSAKLDAARSQGEGDAVAKEITKHFPDKNSAERAMFRTHMAARKASGWAAPKEEPLHDPATGEVKADREPGSDDE